MPSKSLVGVLLARWYITVTGVLLSLVLAALAFSFFPLQYSSSGTAVLMGPKLRGGNPMLDFDPSVNMTTLIMVQALASPEVSTSLGVPPVKNAILHPGQDTYTVKNAGSTDLRDDGVDRPFITITAQSLDPDRSQSIVSQVLDEAQRQLQERQTTMHVGKGRAIGIQTVVDPEAGKPVFTTSLKAVGAAFVLGLLGTVIAACVAERAAGRRAVGAAPVLADQVVHPSDSRTRWVADAGLESLDGPIRPADLLDEGQFREPPFTVGPESAPRNGRSAGLDRLV